jgi:hypothetical protein
MARVVGDVPDSSRRSSEPIREMTGTSFSQQICIADSTTGLDVHGSNRHLGSSRALDQRHWVGDNIS